MTMTSDESTKPAGATQPDSEDDTEGHSLLDVQLAQTMERDRVRDVAKLDRDAARARQANGKDGGGILRRFGRGRS